MKTGTLGIMAAMEEELGLLLQEIQALEIQLVGKRKFYLGKLWGRPVVATFSQWGKVAASTTATSMILKFDVSQLVFVGVAGALQAGLKVGDVVVGDRLVQHDIDCRPIFPRFEIPLKQTSFLSTDREEKTLLLAAAKQFVDSLQTSYLQRSISAFGIDKPRVIEGLIATGDQFISSEKKRKELGECLPEIACVEMEGAAVAQVCLDFELPFSIVRIISDSADSDAEFDFKNFIEEVAEKFSLGILKAYLS